MQMFPHTGEFNRPQNTPNPLPTAPFRSWLTLQLWSRVPEESCNGQTLAFFSKADLIFPSYLAVKYVRPLAQATRLLIYSDHLLPLSAFSSNWQYYTEREIRQLGFRSPHLDSRMPFQTCARQPRRSQKITTDINVSGVDRNAIFHPQMTSFDTLLKEFPLQSSSNTRNNQPTLLMFLECHFLYFTLAISTLLLKLITVSGSVPQ